MTKAVVLTYTKSTKNTHRFDEAPDTKDLGKVPLVGQIYVQKAWMPSAPSAIAVRLDWTDPAAAPATSPTATAADHLS